jgi:D-alanyl-D-alanine carboxypeptidase
MQSADHFRIGSTTGSFVAALILQEAERGKLHLDAHLSSFGLGVSIPNQDTITVRELLQMQSGLPDVFEVEALRDMARNARFKLTPEESLHYLSGAKPLYAPGRGWNFSHTNYLLLGLIYEKTSGEAISRAIHEHLLLPLRLSKTSYPSTPDLPTPFAHGYELTQKKAWEDVTLALPAGLGAAAGSMISSAADMRRWVKAYVTGEGLSLQARDGRLQCVPTGAHALSFGFGIGCSNGWYGLSGAIAGYETAAWYYPPRDLTIVVMVNAKSHDQKSLGIADRMLRDVGHAIAAPAVPFE